MTTVRMNAAESDSDSIQPIAFGSETNSGKHFLIEFEIRSCMNENLSEHTYWSRL